MRANVTALSLAIAVVLLTAASAAAALPTMWEKEYGGPHYDVFRWIENTSDGCFIMVGTGSEGEDAPSDVWLVKANPHGDTLWCRHYGGPWGQNGEFVVETPDGGYLAVGSTYNPGTALSEIYLLRVSQGGDSLWDRSYAYAGHATAYGVTRAHEGGYVLAGYADVYNVDTTELLLLKVDEDGNFENGTIVGGPDTDWAHRIRQTSDGGYIVVGATRSYGYGSEDVYLLKFNASRTLEWQETYGGTGWDSGYDVRETPDGGFIVAGATPEGPGPNCAFLVRTDAGGDSIWTKTYGSLGYDTAESIVITPDGDFVFVGRTDSYSLPSVQIFLYRVASNGTPLEWTVYGGDGYDVGSSIQVTPDDGLIIAGRIGTTGMSNQGYAMRTLGLSPRIWAVMDVPGDQGGQLRLCWFRSAYDAWESPVTIVEYSVWRRIDPLPMGGGSRDAGPLVLGWNEFPPGDWDYVSSVPALGENEYCCVVPTLCDWSPEHGVCWSVFFVAAEGAHPLTYFASQPDSGCSTDDLEPSPPGGLHMPAATELAWDESPEDDLDHYTVYGSASGGFEEAAVIGETSALSMDVSAAPYEYYHVTASDHAGNESRDSNVENTFAGVPGGGIPAAFALRQNSPNPFTLSTSICFDLPERSHVAVEVVDVSGRVVRTLVDDALPAGRHYAAWDGRIEAGAESGPGIYFVRMKSGRFQAARKMMLLR